MAGGSGEAAEGRLASRLSAPTSSISPNTPVAASAATSLSVVLSVLERDERDCACDDDVAVDDDATDAERGRECPASAGDAAADDAAGDAADDAADVDAGGEGGREAALAAAAGVASGALVAVRVVGTGVAGAMRRWRTDRGLRSASSSSSSSFPSENSRDACVATCWRMRRAYLSNESKRAS